MTDAADGVDVLADTVTETHDVLIARMRQATTCRPTRERPRDRFSATDPFLASTSRHVGAATAVLLPDVRRHLPDGDVRSQEFARQSRRLEISLAQVKAKLYGSTYAVRRPWASVWDEVEREAARTWDLEDALVADLGAATGHAHTAALADRLYRAEQKVPTRPHPYLPHRGLPGRVARGVALRVDRFWDAAEGRMVPEPVRPRRSRDGRFTRYLLADPQVD